MLTNHESAYFKNENIHVNFSPSFCLLFPFYNCWLCLVFGVFVGVGWIYLLAQLLA